MAVTALLIMGQLGCTSMLLGNNTSGDMSTAAADRGSEQVARDNEISAFVRQQLSTDTVTGKYPLGIRTVDSRVTLSGTVGSYRARDRAVQIANETNNVASVVNRIIVNTNL
jgi:osmotically-inducible protein OsmY